MNRQFLLVYILLTLAISCPVFFTPLSGQTLSKAEYFFDTDPGFGNGTVVALSGTDMIANFDADMSSLSAGVHVFYIRTQDSDGRWSETAYKILNKSLLQDPLPDLVKAEYFFDTDPGFGNGTTVPLSGTDITNNFDADISTLSPGVHVFYVRTQDSDGRWSETAYKILNKSLLQDPLPDLVKAEYYYDTDPGFGNGISVPLSGTNISANFDADMSTLNPGVHVFYVRTQDSDGRWSETAYKILNKSLLQDPLPDLVKAEYFFDTDPGFGNGISVPLSGTNISANFDADMSTLNPGVHAFYIRTQDSGGRWSETAYKIFYKSLLQGSLPDLVKAEYFFDTDPGFGNGTAVPLSGNNSTPTFNADMSALSPGVHTFYIRTQDSDGRWSETAYKILYKPLLQGPLPDLIKAEYFFDTDPGFGNGTSVPLSGVNITTNFDADISTLSIGVHVFYIRTQDGDGRWSETAYQILNKPLLQGPLPDLVKAEYYFDTDPGFGNGIPLPLSGNNIVANFNADMSTLFPGVHQLYIRTLDTDGRWSETAYQSFTKDMTIVRMEYYFDTDPGYGNAPGTNYSGLEVIINTTLSVDMSGLTPGFHYLYLRSKDYAGAWSETAFRTIYIPEPVAAPAPAITYTEYYLNTDPGYGNGVSVPLTGLPSLGFEVCLDNATIGSNRLYVRSRDAAGRWSETAVSAAFNFSGPNCPAPTLPVTISTTTNSALISWKKTKCTENYQIQYKAVGSSIWQTATTVDTFYTLSGLVQCASYEWQISANCSPLISTWTGTVNFTTSGSLYYQDSDGDGYGNPAVSALLCPPFTGYVTNSTDCDDEATGVYPGTTETCNNIDDNCDLVIDDVPISVPSTPGTFFSTAINHLNGATNTYIATCNLLAQIADAPSGNTLGNTTVSSVLSDTVPSPNVDGFIYGRRKYNVNAASTSAATVKLYFTQADFDNYNSSNPTFLDLPTSGDNNDPNKLYFRIARVSGGTYTITASLRDSLKWNSLDNRWEVNFPVTNVNADYYFVSMLTCAGVVVNNLGVTNNAGTSVLATWNSVVTTPPSGWYSLQYRTTQPTPGAWINAGTAGNNATTKLISGLIPGTEYEIQVRRHCSNESEGPWTGLTFMTLTPECAFPPVLTVSTVTANTGLLTWPAVAGAAWYEFRYSTSPTGPWTSGGTLGVPATSRLFTGLVPSTTYYLQARSFCSLNGLPSPWSSNATFTTMAISGCEQAPSLTATIINATNVTVTWPATTGVGWHEFRYRLSPAGPFVAAGTLGGGATSKQYTGLTPGMIYDLQARRFCSNGVPGAWASITVTTVALAGCDLPPTLSVGTVTPTRALLTWPAIVGAGWFEFRYSTSPTGPWTSGGTSGGSATAKMLTGLMVATTYYAQARTFCNNGIPSAWSANVTFTTGAALVGQTAAETISYLDITGVLDGKDQPVATIPADENVPHQLFVNPVSTLSIYPNPTNDIANALFFIAEEAAMTLYVMDMTGRVLQQIEFVAPAGDNTLNVNLGDVADGMYMIQLRDHGRLTHVGKAQKLD